MGLLEGLDALAADLLGGRDGLARLLLLGGHAVVEGLLQAVDDALQAAGLVLAAAGEQARLLQRVLRGGEPAAELLDARARAHHRKAIPDISGDLFG